LNRGFDADVSRLKGAESGDYALVISSPKSGFGGADIH